MEKIINSIWNSILKVIQVFRPNKTLSSNSLRTQTHSLGGKSTNNKINSNKKSHIKMIYFIFLINLI